MGVHTRQMLDTVAKPTQKDQKAILTAATLEIIEGGNAPTYGLFRHLVTEDPDGTRHVLRKLGPLGVFRKAEGNEPVHLRSSLSDGTPINLFSLGNR